METRKRTIPLAKLAKLIVVLVLALAPVAASAARSCPTGCGYTFKNGCCVPAPWSECPVLC